MHAELKYIKSPGKNDAFMWKIFKIYIPEITDQIKASEEMKTALPGLEAKALG